MDFHSDSLTVTLLFPPTGNSILFQCAALDSWYIDQYLTAKKLCSLIFPRIWYAKFAPICKVISYLVLSSNLHAAGFYYLLGFWQLTGIYFISELLPTNEKRWQPILDLLPQWKSLCKCWCFENQMATSSCWSGGSIFWQFSPLFTEVKGYGTKVNPILQENRTVGEEITKVYWIVWWCKRYL